MPRISRRLVGLVAAASAFTACGQADLIDAINPITTMSTTTTTTSTTVPATPATTSLPTFEQRPDSTAPVAEVSIEGFQVAVLTDPVYETITEFNIIHVTRFHDLGGREAIDSYIRYGGPTDTLFIDIEKGRSISMSVLNTRRADGQGRDTRSAYIYGVQTEFEASPESIAAPVIEAIELHHFTEPQRLVQRSERREPEVTVFTYTNQGTEQLGDITWEVTVTKAVNNPALSYVRIASSTSSTGPVPQIVGAMEHGYSTMMGGVSDFGLETSEIVAIHEPDGYIESSTITDFGQVTQTTDSAVYYEVLAEFDRRFASLRGWTTTDDPSSLTRIYAQDKPDPDDVELTDTVRGEAIRQNTELSVVVSAESETGPVTVSFRYLPSL